MGIDKKIINEWLPAHIHTNLPWSFHPLQVSTHPQLSQVSNQVVFLDLTERLRKIPPMSTFPNTSSQLVTVDYICQSLHNLVTKWATGRPYVFILLDKKGCVPIEKKQTQDKRKKASQQQNIHPYPPHTPLSGIQTSIDPSRLAISWHVVLQFVDYWLLYMKRRQPYPNHIVFDCEEDQAPLLLVPNTTTSERRLEWYNEIGESEMRIFWFIKKLQSSSPSFIPVLCITDTDCVPIGLRYLCATPQHSHPLTILWFRGDSHKVYKNPKHVRGMDLVALYKALMNGRVDIFKELPLDQYQNRVYAFIMSCAFNDTDYTDKKDLSHMFGIDAICKAVCDSWSLLQTGIVDHSVVRFVHSLYGELIRVKQNSSTMGYLIVKNGSRFEPTTTEFIKAYEQSRYWIETHLRSYGSKKRYIVPTFDTIVIAVKKARFTWTYWDIPFYHQPSSSSMVEMNPDPNDHSSSSSHTQTPRIMHASLPSLEYGTLENDNTLLLEEQQPLEEEEEEEKKSGSQSLPILIMEETEDEEESQQMEEQEPLHEMKQDIQPQPQPQPQPSPQIKRTKPLVSIADRYRDMLPPAMPPL